MPNCEDDRDIDDVYRKLRVYFAVSAANAVLAAIAIGISLAVLLRGTR